jgi:hypothetical protein
VSPSGSPTVRRRRLAAELRRLRGRQTGTQVARAIGWSPTKISRAESGRESIPPQEVEKLLDFYGVVQPLRGQLLDLAEDATQQGWWEDYAGVLPPEYLEFIGLENEASFVAECQADVVPGLLQTQSYIRQIYAGYERVIPTPPSVISQFVRARVIRQERLTREPLLQFSAVIDQSVLLRRMGSDELMRAQLQHLADMGDLPNVDLRILPLDRETPLVVTSFTILSFGTRTATDTANLGDVVSSEAITADLYVEGETDTYQYKLFYQALHDASLSPEDSRLLIASTAQHVWSER